MTAAVWLAVTLLGAGSVHGTVTYRGPSVRARLLAKSEASCPTGVPDDALVVAKRGLGLANVVVRVVEGAKEAVPPPAAVVVRQRGCRMQPRVQGAVKGQRLQLKNEDSTRHNAHAWAGLDETKTVFNVTLAPGAPPVERDTQEVAGLLRLRCDAHPWERGYVLFSSSGLYAVSDAEGRWALSLPEGNYRLEAWHEKLGSQLLDVAVKDGETAELPLVFK